MATRTQPDPKDTDASGIERTTTGGAGPVDEIRHRQPWIDHIMRMQERFAAQGGNQFSAGTTYFSVMSMFPLLMLLFAALGAVLANRPDIMSQIEEQISAGLPEEIGSLVSDVINQAIAQRGAVAGIGGITALWSGLGWMNNLRAGVSAMWGLAANEGGNFVMKKIWDLVALLGMMIALIIAFGMTAIGSSGLTQTILERLGIEGFPGMSLVIFLVGLSIGLLANFVVMFWMMKALPRTKVPRSAALKGALIGAIAFEIIKQLSTVIFSSAVNNPAGAIFGPVVGLMIIMYLIWRVVMYVAAWTATTEEALTHVRTQAPDPAIIRVRQEARPDNTGVTLGVGAALGASVAGLIALLTRK